MNVLLTGGDGYIGSVLRPMLEQDGHAVEVLDYGYYARGGWDPVPPSSPLVDVRTATPDLSDVDSIIHLAALSNDPLGQLSTSTTLEINHTATVRLARMAKAAGVPQFLYASSCSLYGRSHTEWVEEEAPTSPLTAYAESKVRSERDLAALSDPGFRPVILRCSTVYGDAPRLRLDLVVNNLTAWAVTTGRIQLQSDGTPWRPLIHVQDLCRAYLHFLERPLTQDEPMVYNVGFEAQNHRVRDIAKTVEEEVPPARAHVASQPDRDARSYRVRFDRFHERAGLRPQWDVRSAVRHLAARMREKGLTLADFQSGRFQRLPCINELRAQGKLDDELRWRMT